MYNILNTGTAVTITTTNNLIQDAFPTEASYFSINSSIFVAVNSSSKRVVKLENISNFNPLIQTPKQFLDALLTAGVATGISTSSNQILEIAETQNSNNLLAQIVSNTGGTAAESFSLDYGTTKINLPNTDEYLMYLFRVKAGETEATIKNVLVSVLAEGSKDILTRLSINQNFDYSFVNSNFQSINSKIEYAKPNENGTPAAVKVTGFSTNGKQLLSKYGREKTVLNLLNSEPLIVPENITYSLTVTALTSNAEIYPSISWNQIN